MSNDVPLHFGGPRLDCISASAQVGVRPNPFVDGAWIAAQQLTIWAEQLLRDLLEPLVELAPENLLNRTLRARHACSGNAAECPHLVEAHDFDLRAALRELLSDKRILRSGLPVALDASRKFNQTRDRALEYEMQASAVGTPLVHQRAHGHIPSVVYLAENVLSWNANVAKENLVEFGFASHLSQRTNLNSGRLHIDEEHRKSLVFSDTRIRANHQLAPVTDPTEAGPHFLAVNDVVIAVQSGFHLQTGEIGAGVGFRKALAPDFFRAQNLRDVTFLLRLCSEGDDGGSDEAQAKRIGHRRRLDTRHLFPKYGLFDPWGAPAA